MKKILIVCFLILVSLSIQSQNELGKSDDEARIVLSTFIPDDILENAPSARKLFATKLGQIATRNGMGGGGASGDNRFIISGDINHVLPQTLTHLNAGILVLGTTYRTGLLGITAQRLIEAVDCDLLAIKPKGFEAPFHWCL